MLSIQRRVGMVDASLASSIGRLCGIQDTGRRAGDHRFIRPVKAWWKGRGPTSQALQSVLHIGVTSVWNTASVHVYNGRYESCRDVGKSAACLVLAYNLQFNRTVRVRGNCEYLSNRIYLITGWDWAVAY